MLRFFLGLEIKPCESRLEFVHPQKIKKTVKQMIKQQKKTTKEEETSTLPAKSFFLFFFLGPMGLGETLAIFFSAFLEFAPDFQETNVYEPNFATFFW